MKEIQLGASGKFAQVDDEDFEWLSKYTWGLMQTGYARRVFMANGKQHTVLMHREILNARTDEEVDHIDGFPLNNQRFNIRICSHQQNLMNRRMNKLNECGFKGVNICNVTGKYVAKIQYQRKAYYLGIFKTPEEANEAYRIAAIKFFGEFAKW